MFDGFAGAPEYFPSAFCGSGSHVFSGADSTFARVDTRVDGMNVTKSPAVFPAPLAALPAPFAAPLPMSPAPLAKSCLAEVLVLTPSGAERLVGRFRLRGSDSAEADCGDEQAWFHAHY